MYQIIDMYLYREPCACVVLSFVCYPRPLWVWMGFLGLSSPWAVLSICVSLSRSPQKRPTQTNDIIRVRLSLLEEKLWAELCLAFCLVSLQTPSSRSLVKRDLDGPLCTAVLSQFILREITVLKGSNVLNCLILLFILLLLNNFLLFYSKCHFNVIYF